MDENMNNDIFIIMQKILDKLKYISEAVDKKDNSELSDVVLSNNSELKEQLDSILEGQLIMQKMNVQIGYKVIDTIVENKTSPNVNNYSEYSFLGSKSHFKPWALIAVLFSLILMWSSIKYIPSYLTEISSLKKEKDEFQLFYNYAYLKQFESTINTTANETLKKIQQKDTVLMNEYHMLLNTYKKEIRKQELNEELKSLENNDH